MNIILLKDENINPDEGVLKTVLDKVYPVYAEFVSLVCGNTYGLKTEWRYYKDGHAWLCKVVNGKKTIFWLSVWDEGFKLGFYFTEKTVNRVFELEIDESIKSGLRNAEHIGKFIPLTILVKDRDQFPDILKIVNYKKSLK